jgi:hypothetical protein
VLCKEGGEVIHREAGKSSCYRVSSADVVTGRKKGRESELEVGRNWRNQFDGYHYFV